MIDTFYAATKNTSYQTIPYTVWSHGKLIEFNKVRYTLSKDGDSIIASLNGNQMRNISLLQAEYDECIGGGRTGYSTFYGCKIDNIPESATLSLIITGNFPLSVNASSQMQSGFFIDLLSKTLKLSALKSIQDIPLPCYDLLGRKHNLEFLRTDGEASTYSLRSLPAGLYFVSDGREMVKFLVAQ
jgi:hypothetical protein